MTDTKLLEERKRITRLYQADPVLYFEKVLGVESLEIYQKHVIQKVAENDRVAISACHDVGKSFLMARIALWFMSCFKNSKVITTAPTYNQVEKILWSELRSAYAKAKIPLGGKINLTDWKISDDWFALGFTPRNELSSDGGQGTQSSFQGFHASHLLVIFDEATGIPPNIWTMAEGLLTSAHVKFVCIGNPTSKNSEFYHCFKSPAWTKIYLSCFDSPNLQANNLNDFESLRLEIEKVRGMNESEAKKYLDNYKVVRPYLLTAKWVVQNSIKWGLDHPLTVSKVLGKFPEASDNTLVPLSFVEQAQSRTHIPKPGERKIIGVDVARFGSDSTVLTSLFGKQQLGRKELFKNDTVEVVGEVLNLAMQMNGVDVIVIDETGIGGGVVDLLREEQKQKNSKIPKGCEIRGVQFGESCEDDEDREKYYNMKARMFGLLREDLKASDGLCLLNESAYLEELPTILYKFNQKGQMVIESKDEYKKRTGRKSPDNADSLALANFGRYDEIKIGVFSEDFTTDTPKPFSGSLNTSKSW